MIPRRLSQVRKGWESSGGWARGLIGQIDGLRVKNKGLEWKKVAVV